MAVGPVPVLVAGEPAEWRVLACGIDSLDLSLVIHWGPAWQEIVADLELAKARASGSDGILWRTLGRLEWLVLPTGRQNYRFHLQSVLGHLYLSTENLGLRLNPNGYLSLAASSLWCKGGQWIAREFMRSIRALGGRVALRNASRVDLTADFEIPAGLSRAFVESHLVCHAHKRNAHLSCEALETFYVGASSSPRRLRIYDKVAELRNTPHKHFFFDLWQVPKSSRVWRVEFQLRRDFLRKWAIHDVLTLIRMLPALWKLCTEWVELRQPDDSNTTRRSLHPFWASVQQCGERFGPWVALEVPVDEVSRPDPSQLLASIGGSILTLGAMKGLRCWDEVLEETLTALSLRRSISQYDAELARRRILRGTEHLRYKSDYPPSWDETEGSGAEPADPSSPGQGSHSDD